MLQVRSDRFAAGSARAKVIPCYFMTHVLVCERALSSRVNPRIVSRRLGHSTVALTLDIYPHVLPQPDQEAADKITALIERK